MRLKGTTTIELTDVNTGDVETYTSDNMVTNALESLFTTLGFEISATAMYNSWSPYIEKLLGGILLFDEHIPEDPNTFFAPSSVKMIGCGAFGHLNATDGLCRGSYDVGASEFDPDTKTIKYVYQYSISQANGTFSSVCLTSLYGGFDSYGSMDAKASPVASWHLCNIGSGQLWYPSQGYSSLIDRLYSSNTKHEMLFVIDFVTDTAYYVSIEDDTHLNIIGRRAFLKTISVFDTPSVWYSSPIVFQTQITLPTPIRRWDKLCCTFDTDTDNLYICDASGDYILIGESVQVYTIKFGTWGVTSQDVVNNTDYNLLTTYMNTGTSYINVYRWGFVHKGQLLLRWSDNTTYLIPLDGSASRRLTGVSSYTYPTFALNGYIYCEIPNSTTGRIINTTSGEVLVTSTKGYSVTSGHVAYPVRGRPMHFYVWTPKDANSHRFCFLSNYLATINNLDNPVTKTDDKTMKVTYTIQEIEGN